MHLLFFFSKISYITMIQKHATIAQGTHFILLHVNTNPSLLQPGFHYAYQQMQAMKPSNMLFSCMHAHFMTSCYALFYQTRLKDSGCLGITSALATACASPYTCTCLGRVEFTWSVSYKAWAQLFKTNDAIS